MAELLRKRILVSFLKRTVASTALFFSAIFFALALSEIVLRIAWAPPSLSSTPAFEAHEVYGVAPIPGITGMRSTPEYTHTYSHTAQGFRGGPGIRPVAASAQIKPRLLFLGDSFTYGLGSSDDEIFVSIVARNLGDIEVVNGGVNGFGQRDELAMLDAIGSRLQPNLVVLMFFWNDLEDNLKEDRPTFKIVDDRVVRTDLKVPDTFNPLAMRSAPHIEPPRADSLFYYTKEMIKEGIKGFRYRYFGISARDITNEAQKTAAWEITKELFVAIDTRVRELGSRLLVVSIPDHNRVNASAVIKNIEPINYDIEDELRATLESLGIEYIDLLEAMSAAYRSTHADLYYYADRHLTPLGNQVVASAISDVIGDRLRSSFEMTARQ
jgi:lysophospholipase L1-like esterase